jgi:4-diphosphocytidyl-2-C-methyl-D-erythritol kinase
MKLFGLKMPGADLERMALSLGADVPVCLTGQTCRMQGVGERITPIAGFKPLHAVLVNPGATVATAEVFGKLGLAKGERFGAPIADRPSWHNDLTAPAIKVQPVISEVIEAVPGARMSGSGATCFAIVESRRKAAEVAKDLQKRRPTWWIRETTIGG